ncbi:MAG: hypothetical protein EBQ76_05320 [Betaproteobacteria bacterium]|nr:hypothetical protein [Betaproteobacteria bacterium]NBY14150.1 hypothetical protein [Betaproteobacteria bacterium]
MDRLISSSRVLALLSLAHFLLGNPAHSALGITPPQLLPDEAGIVVTEVQSSTPNASRWSVRLVNWTPGAGEPTPVASDISPRFFSLAPGARQIIRAKVRDRGAYHRLIIEQVPDPEAVAQGLAFRFRFSLPIYRQPQEPLALSPNLPSAAGCYPFKNSQSLAVRLVLSKDLLGPNTLLPGESAELCRTAQTAKN